MFGSFEAEGLSTSVELLFISREDTWMLGSSHSRGAWHTFDYRQ